MTVTPYTLCEGLFAAFGLAIFILKIRDENVTKVQKTWADSAYLILLITSFALVFLGGYQVPGLSYRLFPTFGYYGTVIAAIGLSFATWGRLILGKFWTGPVCIVEGHRLQIAGPYRITRHPMYSGLLIGLVGTALTQGEVRSVLAVALITVAFRYRITNEEKMLTEYFGAEYKRYQTETACLLPGFKLLVASTGTKHASVS
jgi:protein-S-isoprenylcysteine O-methyltransferase Ste14